MSTARATISRFMRLISPFRPTSSCGYGKVAHAERLLGLEHLCLCKLTHTFDRVEDVSVLRRIVTRKPHELADVHALVAHPLDAPDDVQQRRDDPQIASDWRLPRQQRQRTRVDLQVALVDPVVVSNHRFGKLDVLEADRLERAVQLLRDHVQPAAASAARAH